MAKKNRKLIIASIIAVVVIVLGVLGIGILLRGGNHKTPIDLTKEYMNQYKNCDSEVVKKIKYPFEDELTKAQKAKYKEIIKSQYMALDYEITEETVGEIDAIIKVEFSVLDYKASYEKATSYLRLYGQDKTEEKKVDYKLSEMEHTGEKEKYSIEFTFHKLDGEWEMMDLTDADLEKLQGIF
ncbi:MAG: hypothetical protein IJ193_04845 [Bacilli bacterium]|nr:hypothetical protein [Bacilli bacterium]